MNEAHVSSLFVKWSNKINAPVSAHRFRHAAATKIANSGYPIIVAMILGLNRYLQF
jgi:integrase